LAIQCESSAATEFSKTRSCHKPLKVVKRWKNQPFINGHHFPDDSRKIGLLAVLNVWCCW